MKRFAISMSVIALTFLVLLGSGGFTVGKMICGGNECSSTYTLGKAKDCCTSENTASESLSCCCELIDVSYSLDEFSASEKANVSPQELTSFISSCAFVLHLPSALFHLPCADIPPPDTKNYLHFIGSLLL